MNKIEGENQNSKNPSNKHFKQKFNMQQQSKKSKHTSAVIDACYKRCTDNAI